MADDPDAAVTVGLVAQRANERAHELAAALQEGLESQAAVLDVVLDELTASALSVSGRPVAAMSDCDLVVSIGGDGTLLFVAREVSDTPILGVNLGEVGFLNAVAPGDALDVVPEIVSQLQTSEGLETQRRTLRRLTAMPVANSTEPTTDSWTLDPALNEIVVHGPRRGHGGGATITVEVDGRQYVDGHADGVLVTTPTGSTAYNLSEGGPLVHPDSESLVVTQMAATDGRPPLVVDADATVTVTVDDADSAFVISDGRDRQQLEPPASVTIASADDPVTLVGPQSDFFAALEKLE
ncbi:putative NAD kinase (polyphosphate/ATP) [Natrialba magadii ATCC 43099]|uniref:NAD kinase n=1 Tax=Natrialba magadii (strain ATCC 43099 / DSM 3394 / CCM 3739 / CIP 104546 / IAM 13178 / JCM 8861 / NBRC 102185 / NCIMB 2190 / MS3) TaxID=547559 RepID=D3T0C3_NATMM|nr:NAD(+)/NADH kinase [Natrialba magadii]ADD06402.1 putative NAD kinase (polyphosphate/ATP) [Natrialba magadii ATCC 43099]ELY31571.1 ATP-NAD/AcoX kinase [Natrialba magadii ATCC 43099]